MNKEQTLKQFQIIPGIGRACSLDLWNIGLRKLADLNGQNPAYLYKKLNSISGYQHDICILYTLRCAVVFVTENHPEEGKLKWWYWKDKKYNEG